MSNSDLKATKRLWRCFLGRKLFTSRQFQKEGGNSGSCLHTHDSQLHRSWSTLQMRGVGLPGTWARRPPKSPKRPGGSPSILAQSSTSHSLGVEEVLQSHSAGSRAESVTAPLEGCVTQPLSSHILSAARWAQIPLWEATNNFLLLARVAARLLLLFGTCFHSPLLLGSENPALNV